MIFFSIFACEHMYSTITAVICTVDVLCIQNDAMSIWKNMWPIGLVVEEERKFRRTCKTLGKPSSEPFVKPNQDRIRQDIGIPSGNQTWLAMENGQSQ